MSSSRAPATERAERGFGGDTRREAVVDQHDITVFHVGQRPSTSIALDSSFQLRSFLLGELGELCLRHTEPAQRGSIGNDLPAFGDRADSQLGLSGSPDLPDDEHVERSTQRLRDLEGDRHPAARKRQDQRVVQPRSKRGVRRVAGPRRAGL